MPSTNAAAFAPACSLEMHPVWTVANKFAAHMAKYELRRTGGRKQLLQTCRLFVLLLLERQVYSIEALQKKDFSAFRELLSQVAKCYGKSKKGKTRSLEELREIGAAKPEHLRGLAAASVNKHLSALSGLVDFVREETAPLRSDIDPLKLRLPDKQRERNRTQAASPTRLEVMFGLPPSPDARAPKSHSFRVMRFITVPITLCRRCCTIMAVDARNSADGAWKKF